MDFLILLAPLIIPRFFQPFFFYLVDGVGGFFFGGVFFFFFGFVRCVLFCVCFLFGCLFLFFFFFFWVVFFFFFFLCGVLGWGWGLFSVLLGLCGSQGTLCSPLQ